MELNTALKLVKSVIGNMREGASTSYRRPPPTTTHTRPDPMPVSPLGFRSVPYDQTTVANQPRLIKTVGGGPLTKPGILLWPTTFNVYDKEHFHWHRRVFVGEHMDQPLYRITSRSKRLNARYGTSKSDPVVATLVHKSFRTRESGSVIPPLRYGPRISLDKDYSFTCLVPTPDGRCTRPERFEWRRSRGKAVNRLGRSHGYKLVRLATDAGSGGGDIAMGGGEVVLVMARDRAFAWRKAAQIMFQGSGAQGILGEHWQLVAGMTAIGIWDYKRRQAQGPALAEA